MPIEVRHDTALEALAATGLAGAALGAGRGATEAQLSRSAQIAQTAARIGAARDMQVRQLGAQRDMQMEQIEAQADRQKEAADTAYARTALAAGLQEEIQEQQFDNELEKMQEAARVQADQWEIQYTTQQRQEITKFNNARQMISRDTRFSPEEKEAALRLIDLQQANIEPSMMPRDPNKPQFAEGQEPGAPFIHSETGATLTTVIGSSGQPELKLLVRPDQTIEYLQEKIKAEQADAERVRQEKLEDERRKYEITLETRKIPEMVEAVEGGFLGYGATEAGPTGGERFLTLDERRALSEKHFGSRPQEQQVEPQIPAGRLGVPRKLISWSRGMDVRVTGADADLPGFVGIARAFLREVQSRTQKGERISPNMTPAIQEARAILTQYAASEGL